MFMLLTRNQSVNDKVSFDACLSSPYYIVLTREEYWLHSQVIFI